MQTFVSLLSLLDARDNQSHALQGERAVGKRVAPSALANNLCCHLSTTRLFLRLYHEYLGKIN
jgi:hypothetical protein